MNKYAQMADRLYDLNEQLERLEKENAELKEVHESDKRSLRLIAEKGAELEKEKAELVKQLDKAKEIIRNLLRVTYGEGWNYSLDWKVKAEQFLKECE